MRSFLGIPAALASSLTALTLGAGLAASLPSVPAVQAAALPTAKVEAKRPAQLSGKSAAKSSAKASTESSAKQAGKATHGSFTKGSTQPAANQSAQTTPPAAPPAQQDEAAKPEFYTQKVHPIFVEHCERCHLGDSHKGGFNMQTRENLLKGGHDGAVVIPGDPDKSLLIRLMRHQGPANDPMPMPPRGAQVSDPDIATVAQWIKAGAVMP